MKNSIFLLTLFLIIGCVSNSNELVELPPYPTIEKQNYSHTYYGKTINDEYRNLENSDDSIVNDWFQKQKEFSDDVLGKIENRKQLAEFLSEIDSRRDFYVRNLNISKNGYYFYLKKLPEEPKYKLFYRKSFQGKEQLIFDPKDFNSDSENDYVINYIKPSPNGRYVVISLTYKGREYSEAVIYDMKLGRVLPDIVIDHCWLGSFYGVDWLSDNSGFVYLHFPNLYDDSKTSKHNSESVFYKIGQDPKNLNVLLSAKNNPELNLDNKNYPILDIKGIDSKYIIAYMVNVGNYYDSYYASIDELESGNINWKPLLKKEDKSYRTSGILDNDIIYYRSSKNAADFKILSIDLKDQNKKENLVVEQINGEVIKDFDLAGGNIFFTTLKNGVEAKLYKRKNGKNEIITLPRESGAISIKTIDKNNLIVYLNGWLNGSQRYIYNTENDSFELKDLKPSGKYPEFEDFIVKEIEIPSHDGTLVPLSIIHHKDIEMNGKNPVFMDGYGAYGENMSPYFSPITLAWVAKGGVYATAHVRGGGEKGDTWHNAGLKTTKSNTWKDLISCMEYMIDKGYTSNKHNVIWSSSAGGIMVGRAMTERPDLFKVVISEVGIMNPLRYEESSSGTNFKEFGTVKDSIECMGLIEMDSYLNITNNTNYPATLVTAGMNDPRVTPWQSGKFIAKLQEANTSNNPIIFAIYKDSGHGDGTTIDQVYQEWANVYAFALWQTGHPDFKFKEGALEKK